jgi:transcriptional regulator with XRE-family HTH domain
VGNVDDDDPERIFGRRLKAERLRRGWRLEDLATWASEHGLNVHPSAYSKIEAGQRAVRLREAVAIAQALGIPLGFMLAEDDPTETERRLAQVKAELAEASDRSDAELQRAALLWNEARLLMTKLAQERGGTDEEGT